MNLPNYFLADLPSEASLSGPMVTEACQTLKRNRERYLRDRSSDSLVRALSELAENWLNPDYPFRRMALAADPKASGFAPATLVRGLDAFFRQLTAENLRELLGQELGHPRRLDEFCASSAEKRLDRAALARGPGFLVQIAAGNIPSPALSSMILGLLVRSAQFVKCGTGAAFLPRLFAHSLYEAEPKLGACLEVAEWEGGREELESALYREADCVTATGTDETLAAIRHQVPIHVRFLGYGHRVSFGYITQEVLSGFNVAKAAARAAQDVAAWNQQGCLSPHLFYVERDGRVSSEAFAQLLAEQLARCEETEPRGAISETAAAAIASRRGFYEIRAAHSQETRQWTSPQSTAWTVVYESDPRFELSCLNRFVYVKPVAGLTEALQAAGPVRGRVSTVGLAAAEHRAPSLAAGWGRWGVSRVCPLGQMQNPPLLWRHDGRPSLGDLVTWTDWEMAS
jgi:Acyl-CoA reductase (LuxC)